MWVVGKLDNVIPWINCLPVDRLACFNVNPYPMDSGLPGGEHNLPFKQMGLDNQERTNRLSFLCNNLSLQFKALVAQNISARSEKLTWRCEESYIYIWW